MDDPFYIRRAYSSFDEIITVFRARRREKAGWTSLEIQAEAHRASNREDPRFTNPLVAPNTFRALLEEGKVPKNIAGCLPYFAVLEATAQELDDIALTLTRERSGEKAHTRYQKIALELPLEDSHLAKVALRPIAKQLSEKSGYEIFVDPEESILGRRRQLHPDLTDDERDWGLLHYLHDLLRAQREARSRVHVRTDKPPTIAEMLRQIRSWTDLYRRHLLQHRGFCDLMLGGRLGLLPLPVAQTVLLAVEQALQDCFFEVRATIDCVLTFLLPKLRGSTRAIAAERAFEDLLGLVHHYIHMTVIEPTRLGLLFGAVYGVRGSSGSPAIAALEGLRQEARSRGDESLAVLEEVWREEFRGELSSRTFSRALALVEREHTRDRKLLEAVHRARVTLREVEAS